MHFQLSTPVSLGYFDLWDFFIIGYEALMGVGHCTGDRKAECFNRIDYGGLDASSKPASVPSDRGWRSLPVMSSGPNGSAPSSVGRSAVLHPPPARGQAPRKPAVLPGTEDA